MHKELNSISIIRNYFVKKNVLNHKTNNIDSIYKFFKYLTEDKNKKKFNSLYILNYIYSYISASEVSKRKTSARVFEDLLAIIFNGIVTDTVERNNLYNDVPDYFLLTKDKIASNKREKADIIFDDNYAVSIKTLMIDNKEINMGSFEKKVLFDGFGVSDFLNERKAKNKNDNIGLGSKPQIKSLLEIIEKNGHLKLFKERLIKMYNYIFSDDIIIAIKNDSILKLYFITGDEFCKIISDRIDNIDLLLEIINRWEGNSIRINREKLLENTKRIIELDFSFLNKTVIKSVNEFDYQLHKNYINFFNNSNNSVYKTTVFSELEILFDEFEKNIKELLQ